MSPASVIDLLGRRRQELGVSYADVARMCEVDEQTARRTFDPVAGTLCSLNVVLKVAKVLDVDLSIGPRPASRARLRQAKRKAELLVGLVQGTCALEAQAVDAASIRKLRKRATRELLDGPPCRLWAA